MVSQRRHDAGQVPITRTLVPTSPSSPLGILDVATLQLLLSSSSDPAAHRNTPQNNRDGERPASSELARAYGVCSGDAVYASHRPKRHMLVQAKRQRRLVPSKLEPMRMADRDKPQPVRRKPNAARLVLSTSTAESDPSEQGRIPEMDELLCVCERGSPKVSPHKLRPGLSSPRVGTSRDGNELRRELQWIHSHFPVLQLATTNCSLALRRQLFADTITKHVVRGSLRVALFQWQSVVVHQKQIEASKLKAFRRLVAMFEHAARDQVAHRLSVWVQYVAGCRDVECLAAAVAIQEWLIWCRQRRHGRQHLVALSLTQALATANTKATQIQQRIRFYLAQQKVRHMLGAVTKIQRCVRASQRRRRRLDQQAAVKKRDELLALMRHNDQFHGLLMRNRDRQARKIADAWRQCVAWRAQHVGETVNTLVDQVEFCAAVLSIQRHLRGYQCRFRLHRKTKASVCIQNAWRRHAARRKVRADRAMLLLTRMIAACCLQRTFRRNRQRKKHCVVMQSSTRPMFLRALGTSASFRGRFHVQIVKSAVSVVQSTWRRHADYKRWMRTRHEAVRHIQRWLYTARVLWTWQGTARSIVALRRDQQLNSAARYLQRWLGRRLQAKRTLATRQLLELLTSVMTIQRYYRRKKDPWHRLLRPMVHGQLIQYRVSSAIIQKCWRAYAVKKRHLLALYDTSAHGGGLPHAVGLHGLQDYLIRQQREVARQIQSARAIQKAYRQRLARREGKLLLKKYRLLFQRELRRRQQRRVIHGFLAERQDERARRQQSHAPFYVVPVGSSPSSRPTVSTASPTSLSTAADLAGSPTNSPNKSSRLSPMETATCDDSDVVQCWSDEHQSYYWFNQRTGESVWCG